MPASTRLAFLLIALTSMNLVHGEEPFAFDRAPGKLPKEVVPRHYRITLEPNLAEASVRGHETIRIDVSKTTARIVLNAVGLEIQKASLRNSSGEEFSLAEQADDQAQTVEFTSGHPLDPGAYDLSLEWTGKLGEQPQGLFITRYQAGTGEKRALVTQMEPADARRMFPCWDEPAFRAEFELSARVPENQLAVSNMPVVREKPAEAGWKQVDFASTPPMASYLIAFCAGEFEQLTDEVDGVKLRVITTEGKIEQARYALESTKKILPFYNEYFGMRYPLPKLDQFCFPGFPAGGMENWGAIFYADRTMLYDPAKSSQSTKETVFAVIAHEIAHQWFGDLVTMGWWDNLWLNEGFASWMGTKASDHFNPEWEMWLRAAGSKERAMALDARSTTHPIQQHVADESQARDAFDEITYSKGQAFLRMLEIYLGEDAFRNGIRRYVAQHAYGNTTTADLWSALEAASGKPVASLASGWTEQPGFPLVHLQEDGPALGQVVGAVHGNDVILNLVTLSQERFTIQQHDPKPLTWQIPVSLAPAKDLEHPSTELLGALPLKVEDKSHGQPFKANIGGTGFYRVSYDEKTLAKLKALSPTLPEADRLNLLNDTWALVEADRLKPETFLDLVAVLAPEEKGYAVWDRLVSLLWSMDGLERGQPGRGPFEKCACRLVQPQFDRLGWNPVPGEPQLAASLRSTIIGALGAWGDAAVQREAQARYERFLTDPASLPGDLRGTVLYLVGRQADAATYARLHALAQAEPSTELKQQFYDAMAACQDPSLAEKTLQISITDELTPTLATALVQKVASQGEQTELAWQFTRQNLDALLAKLPSIGASHFVPGVLRNFSDAARADELEDFARRNLPPEAGYSTAKAADEIRFKAALKTRLLPALDAWLGKQPAKPAEPASR